MQGPQAGEPYFPYPGPAVSIGDMGAMSGTEAWRAVTVVEDPTIDLPSSTIIDEGRPFNLRVNFRCANVGSAYALPATFFGNFHALNLLTGTPAAGSPFPAALPTPIAAPIGASGVRGVGDVVTWYSFTAAGLITLPPGTYRIIVHGHEPGAGLMFFHDGTVIHVGT